MGLLVLADFELALCQTFYARPCPRVEGIQLPTALALLLGADLIGAREWQALGPLGFAIPTCSAPWLTVESRRDCRNFR
jgi:hypothetical protein